MELLTVEEVSSTLGFTPQYIRNLIRNGKIPGQKIGKQWIVDSTVLEDDFCVAEKYDEYNTDRMNSMSKLPEIKALSFFSGAMGLDIGLKKAGIEVLLASEIDKACRQTISTNNKEIGIIGDICKYDVPTIRKYAGLKDDDEVDLIIGGPPCQAFSTAGKRKSFDDDRGNAFLRYLDIVGEIKPKYVVIENVRGLLSAPLKHRPHSERGEDFPALTIEEKRGGALYYVMQFLTKLGYSVSFNLYNAANFGAPQKRERLIIFAAKNGIKPPYLEPTHSEQGLYDLPKWRSLKEVIGDIQDGEHQFVNFPEKRLKYYRLLKEGQNWKNLSVEKQKEALGKSFYSQGGKTGFLRRLAWDKPSPTLVTHPTMPATDLAHPVLDRPLSVQEYKRIQEFPDEWIIAGKLLDQYKQIGNAVPVSLGYAIGKHFIKLLRKDKIERYPEFPYSRYRMTDEKSFLLQVKKIEEEHQYVMNF
jgi:DNA (cytosine-5)-methyltransferase 1